MATPQQSPDSHEIVSEIHIAAPCERVFQALVDPSQVVQWWGQAGIYRCRKRPARGRHLAEHRSRWQWPRV
jgi:uncharacterized protein YndB with AHSA1/START domain